MKNEKSQSSQWVNIPLTKNGLLRVSGRLLNISELKKPATNPNNAPTFQLLDIQGKKPAYLSGLFDNGDHFGGDIKTPTGKHRFKIKRVENGFQEIGLTEAIKEWVNHTKPQSKPLLEPSQPSVDTDIDPVEVKVKPVDIELEPLPDIKLEPLPEIKLEPLPDIKLDGLDFNIELNTVDKMKE